MFVGMLNELTAVLLVIKVIFLVDLVIAIEKISDLERIAKRHDCNFYILHDNNDVGCKYQLYTEYEWWKGDEKIVEGHRVIK